MFKRKAKCQHDWKILEGYYQQQGDGDWQWERYHATTQLRAFCKSCGVTDSWKIADWSMTEQQVKDYIQEVYGQ